MCKQAGLSIEDLEKMTTGLCLDYIYTYIEELDPKKPKTQKKRKATQADMDRL
nr:MAG TPA: hypothetical protein [Bacteriophage sp.]